MLAFCPVVKKDSAFVLKNDFFSTGNRIRYLFFRPNEFPAEEQG